MDTSTQVSKKNNQSSAIRAILLDSSCLDHIRARVPGRQYHWKEKGERLGISTANRKPFILCQVLQVELNHYRFIKLWKNPVHRDDSEKLK